MTTTEGCFVLMYNDFLQFISLAAKFIMKITPRNVFSLLWQRKQYLSHVLKTHISTEENKVIFVLLAGEQTCDVNLCSWNFTESQLLLHAPIRSTQIRKCILQAILTMDVHIITGYTYNGCAYYLQLLVILSTEYTTEFTGFRKRCPKRC